jgi:hypothetical protein
MRTIFDGFRFEPIHDDEGTRGEHEFLSACRSVPAAAIGD